MKLSTLRGDVFIVSMDSNVSKENVLDILVGAGGIVCEGQVLSNMLQMEMLSM